MKYPPDTWQHYPIYLVTSKIQTGIFQQMESDPVP